MRHTPHFITEDPEVVKRMIRENSWATIVSNTSAGLVASHYPVILEEDADGISIVSHVGRPDEELHELGQHEILVVIQGPHGYISPSWYAPTDFVPTWNHVTAHLYGIPEMLGDEENFRVLGELVDYFEDDMPHPVHLSVDENAARAIARGTVGFRLRVTRFEARLKLSQNKPPEVANRIIDELQAGEHHQNPGLAREMRRVHHDDI